MGIPVDITLDSATAAVLKQIAASLASLAKTQEKILMATDALTAAVAALSADITSFATDFSAAIAALQAAIGSGSQPAIDAATATLSTLDTEVKAMDATARGLVPPTAPPPGP